MRLTKEFAGNTFGETAHSEGARLPVSDSLNDLAPVLPAEDGSAIGSSRRQGGSVFPIPGSDDGDQDDGFELTATEEPAPKARHAAVTTRATLHKSGEAAQVPGRRHADMPVNDHDISTTGSHVCGGLLAMGL